MVIPRPVNPNGEGSLAVNWVKSEENRRGGSAAGGGRRAVTLRVSRKKRVCILHSVGGLVDGG